MSPYVIVAFAVGFILCYLYDTWMFNKWTRRAVNSICEQVGKEFFRAGFEACNEYYRKRIEELSSQQKETTDD